MNKSLKAEALLVKQQIRKTLSIADGNDIQLVDLMEHFYGPNSEMTKLVMSHCNIDYIHFVKWCNTNFALEAYKCSIGMLHAPDGLMDYKKVKLRAVCLL